jgi:DNA modification methylase
MREDLFSGDMMTVDHGVPTDDTLTSVCGSNSEGFARIVRLYARPGDTICDPTFGSGTFWALVDRSRYRVFATDLKADGVDLRSLPYADASADMLVNDPPYRYTPARNIRHEDLPGHGRVDGQYNLQAAGLTNTQAVLDLYYAGMTEAQRVLKPGGFLVVKCQDTVQDGRNIWVHLLLMRRAEESGFACRDLVVITTKSPTKTRWDRQRHLRKAHSYFLVFRKGGHFPFGMPSVCKR